jgi:nucleoside-diphosphate-sugar epimerase
MSDKSLLALSSANADSLAKSGLDVVVTGGGGWLGQATLEMLEASFRTQMASRVHVFGSSRRSMTLRSGTQLEVFPLHDLSRFTFGPHLVAHYAFATREFVSQLGVDQYIARNEELSNLVATHVLRTRPIGILSLSSGAVYLGDDIATNPYGVLKARDERRFFEMAQELAAGGSSPRVVIPRLFNLSGPFLNKPDYVLGSIIRDIGRGGPIRLHAPKPVIRSYIHIEDLVNLAFAMMLGGAPLPDTAFDTAGEREIEVSDLAELASSVLGHPRMEILRPAFDGSPEDRYVGDPSTFDFLARSHEVELHTLPQQIKDTALFIQA